MVAQISSMASVSVSVSVSASILLLLLATQAVSANELNDAQLECQAESTISGQCRDAHEALKLKLIAIASILVASIMGVCLPLCFQHVPWLHPDSNTFVLVKAFASGVILATGYMHVLPDAYEFLTSDCLPETPWSKFPFTMFVAMISAVATQMVDSFAMSLYKKKNQSGYTFKDGTVGAEAGNGHGHGGSLSDDVDDTKSRLIRHRVVAQVLEMGIVVHSVVIGLSMGASDNVCTIKSLVAALCFHQLFEGMGLGGCILQGEFSRGVKATMALFFSITTPGGIAIGIALSKTYDESSPSGLIVVGLLNACSAGLLNYMALVDLMAVDFMGPKLQSSLRLQAFAYTALLMGAGGMSLMAKWA